MVKVCHSNVLEIVTPIKYNNRVEGAIFFGPFKYESKDQLPPDTIYQTNVSQYRSDKHSQASLTNIDGNIDCIKALLEVLSLAIENKLYTSFVDQSENDFKHCIEVFFGKEFMNELTLGKLAKYLGYCQSRTSQLVKSYFGKTFTELLNQYRLEYAKSLLTNSYITIENIAIQSGFKDPTYFHRIFKKRIGLTPTQFRKHHLPNSYPL